MFALGPPAPRIGYLIKRVERGLRMPLDAALAPHGWTTPEYTALGVLRQRAGLSSARLARRSFVSTQAMNALVVSLERRSIIVRTADQCNARIQQANWTAKALRLLDDCDNSTAAVEVEAMRSGPGVARRRARGGGGPVAAAALSNSAPFVPRDLNALAVSLHEEKR
jgi:DNA-binding MarR family transcriptional regulator